MRGLHVDFPRAGVQELQQHPAEVPQSRVIRPGVDGHLANYHLQRNVTERLVSLLQARACYVMLEAPPTGDGANVYVLAPFVYAAIMAVEVPRSRREEVRAGVTQLDRMGAAVLGPVLLPSLGKAPRPPAGSASPATEPPAIEPRTRDSRTRRKTARRGMRGRGPLITPSRVARTGTASHTPPWPPRRTLNRSATSCIHRGRPWGCAG